MSEGVGIALQGFGAGFSAMGNMQAGRYAKQAADYNASVSEAQAVDAEKRGEVAVSRQRAITRGVIGAQRAAMAAQGQDPASGSALDVQLDAAYLGEIDAQTLRTNSQREAWGFRVQAQDSRVRGQIAQAEGQSRAVGTILGTAGNLALAKYGFRDKRPSGYAGGFTDTTSSIG